MHFCFCFWLKPHDRTRVGGLNEDEVKKYFHIIEETIKNIEAHNGCKISGIVLSRGQVHGGSFQIG